METSITFKDADSLVKLCNSLTKFRGECDITNGCYTVDARSILAMMNLIPGRSYRLSFYSTDTEEINAFKNLLASLTC